jgi:hypothetical protein
LQVTTPSRRRTAGASSSKTGKGAGGVTGSSFNIYDPAKKKWRQTWVDGTGGILDLEGTFSDGRMVLASAPASKTDVVNRITWERLPDGRVRQFVGDVQRQRRNLERSFRRLLHEGVRGSLSGATRGLLAVFRIP